MKFVSVFALFTAALVSAETQEDVSYQESQAWHGCTDSLVQEYDQGATGDVPSCNLWDCLHKQASYYNRGGAITAISNLLTPTCLAARLPNPVSGPPSFCTVPLMSLCFFFSASSF